MDLCITLAQDSIEWRTVVRMLKVGVSWLLTISVIIKLVSYIYKKIKKTYNNVLVLVYLHNCLKISFALISLLKILTTP